MKALSLQILIRLYRYTVWEEKRHEAMHGATSTLTVYYSGRAAGLLTALQVMTEEMKTVPNPLPV